MALNSSATVSFPNRQHGGVSALLLYPLAFIGFIAVIIVIIALFYYQPAEGSSAGSNKLIAGSEVKKLSPDLKATFDRSCAVCHSQPATGAPASGDALAWQPRLAQGMESLLEHTTAGHNGMPPMGLCMECSQDEFVAFIEFMAQLDSGLECAE